MSEMLGAFVTSARHRVRRLKQASVLGAIITVAWLGIAVFVAIPALLGTWISDSLGLTAGGIEMLAVYIVVFVLVLPTEWVLAGAAYDALEASTTKGDGR